MGSGEKSNDIKIFVNFDKKISKKKMTKQEVLKILKIQKINLGVSTGSKWLDSGNNFIESFSPIDEKLISKIKQTNEKCFENVIIQAKEAFLFWKKIPAPRRGEIVRQIGDEFRIKKEAISFLVSYETGKIIDEARGEVQEMIDICDFAVGQSRMLYGMTTHSERPGHRLFEQYHPLGIVGIISAFNFPVAVWSWNAMIALVCGDVIVWKPSPKATLCAVAVQKMISSVLKKNNIPEGVVNLISGNAEIGEWLINDKRISLISFTGSTNIGRHVNTVVAARFGKTILELGGNNAIIITPDADLKLAIKSIVFGAVGTAGQRCTSTRRLIIHELIYEKVKNDLLKIYKQLKNKIGNPLEPQTLIGPLVSKDAVINFVNAQKQIISEGGQIIFGGQILKGKDFESECYVIPALAEVKNHFKIVQQETFAPILYLIKYKTFNEAIALQNDVPQGLSSAIFSKNIIETEKFISVEGSDCGIANVNIGTSGAEIGGAFGGEKESGGGRESGSDVWKNYMRRQTCTINSGNDLLLAQGIKFDI